MVTMRLRSIALPAVATALALAGLTAPAHAEPSPAEPMVGVLVPEQVTVVEGKSKTIRAQVLNAGETAAKGVVLKFAGVDPSLGLTLPAGCDADGCAVGDLAPGARKTVSFTVAPTGTDLTSTFELSVAGFAQEVTVIRAKGGVDLELEPIADLKLGRGQSANLPIVVRNTGSETVDSIGVVLLAESGLEALTNYRNCIVEDETEILGGVICLFEQEFPAGATFTVPEATPLRIRVAADAGGPYTYGGAVVAVGVNDEAAAALAKKSGPTLRLQSVKSAGDVTDGEAPDDINVEDNLAAFGVTVPKSSADVAAVGASFTGAIGDTKTVQVGVRNLGPTGLVPGSVDWIPTVRVTTPTGIDLTEVDEACAPGTGLDDFDFRDAGTVDGRDYICLLLGRLGKGDAELFAFTGTIADAAHTAGSVVVDGGSQDTAKANDKAAIQVRLTAGGGGGGLPTTGAPAGWVALGGVLLLLAGFAIFVVARRRRIVTTL
jgi:LPXTG-motif cell wall-anchored protein